MIRLVDESGNPYLFRRASSGGAYVQISPVPGTSASTLVALGGGGWMHREADGHLSRTFDGSGRIIRYANAVGRGITIQYDGSPSRPSQVDDDWGRPAWLPTYNTNGKIVRIDFENATEYWTYEYAGDHLDKAISPEGVWRDYNGTGAGDAWRITAIVDPQGNTVETHNYDSAGRATDSHGPSAEIDTIDYWLAGRVTGEYKTVIHLKSGSTETHYQRTVGGRMRTVQVSGGCSTCGSKDSTYVHDVYGNVTRHQGANGYITENVYDAAGAQRVSTRGPLAPSGCDPAADTAHCRKTPDELKTVTLDVTAETLTSSFAFGDANWPQRPTAVTIDSLYSTSGAPKSRNETFAYDAVTGETLTHTIEGWTGTVASPTQESRTTSVSLYDGTEGAAFTPGGSVFLSTWETLAQPARMRKSVDGPRSDVTDRTRYVYYPVDVAVPVKLRGRLAAVENAPGHITRFEDYDHWGSPLVVVDPNGVKTTTATDGLGRRTSATVNGITGCDTAYDSLCATDLTTAFTYHGAGALETEQRPAGGVTSYEYDSRSRLNTVSRGPSVTDLREQQETTYDADTGKKDRERLLAKEGLGWVEKTRESFVYDDDGQMESQVHADASAIHYTYDGDGRVKTVQDEIYTAPNTWYVHDPSGRLKTVKQTLRGAPDGEITTSYGYDRHGNMAAVTDPNGNVTTYAYDDFGQMLRQVSPVTGMTIHSYDPAGNLTSSTDANGATTTRTYDALNRGLTAVSTRTGLTTETVISTYDESSVSSFAKGRLTRLGGPEGDVKYQYNRVGLLLSEKTPDTNTSYGEVTTTYAYDADGNRSRIAYPSGRMSVTHTFDYAGRPVGATGTYLIAGFPGSVTTTLVHSASYLPFGPIKHITFGNGIMRTSDYDNRYRMSYNTLIRFVSQSSIDLAKYWYSYDARGNVTRVADQTNWAFDRNFRYDGLNRLTGADGRSTDQPELALELWGNGSYTYDAMGNMTLASLGEAPIDSTPEPGSLSVPDPLARPLSRRTTFTYIGTTSKLDNVAEWGRELPTDPVELRVKSMANLRGRSVTYDTVGNEIGFVAARTYSARNLLASVTDWSEDGIAPHTVQYGYDGRGVRTRRTESPATETGGPATRNYYYTPELQLLSVSADDGPNLWAMDLSTVNPMRYEIIWFGGLPIAQTNSSDSLAAPRFTFTDHIGTPIIQTNATGDVIWQAEYEPFGNIYKMRVGERFDQPLRFPGQEVAMTWEGTEENYNIFRWYRAGWGRYTQADPLGVGGRGHFGDGRLTQTMNPDLLPGFAVQDVRLASAMTSSAVSLYGYAAMNPLAFTDPKGLETILCTVRRLHAFPGFRLCTYVGVCIGTVSHDVYLAAGYVHVEYGCQQCSKYCFYESESNAIMEPRDFRCIPRMGGRWSPDNPMDRPRQ